MRIEGLTIRAALVLGFGLTLGLWLFAGAYFTRRVATIQLEADQVNARYTRAQELLANTRGKVLEGSIAVRDALLDSDPEAIVRSRAVTTTTFNRIDEGLRQYVPVLDPSERRSIEQLRAGIGELRGRFTTLLAHPGRSTEETNIALRDQIVPQRKLALDISDELQALNRAAFIGQQAEVGEIYRSTQRRMWVQLGLALAASLGIGLLATIYAARLESRLQAQHQREINHVDDLQRLSAKLITAQEEERRGIARELHDELGQVLSAIKVEIALARRSIESSGSASPHLLEEAEAIADTALTTVRDLSHLLHPSMLDDLGLPAAVDWYLRGFGTRYGVRVELRTEGMEQRLLSETEVSAYRIIQEALTNVARHAGATQCRVHLQRLVSTIVVTIEDNGRGFDPERTSKPEAPRGLGLLGIRERAALLRGTMRLESGPGTGTRLTVELPAVSRAPEADAVEVMEAVNG
jgi:signal transduction histidine kinase